jgi:hypothetical protein
MTPQKEILSDRIYVGGDTTLYNHYNIISHLSLKGRKEKASITLFECYPRGFSLNCLCRRADASANRQFWLD